MIVHTYTVGAGKRRHDVYGVCSTPAENGSGYLSEIVRFDDLETAATVLRYLAGAELTEADRIRAQEAMKKAAAPTDQSRCNRAAE